MSAQTQHTPGPWWWDNSENADRPTLKSPSGDVCDFGTCEDYYCHAPQLPSKADASLIKAAPVMLAALKRIKETRVFLGAIAQGMMDDAIAYAEGENHE